MTGIYLQISSFHQIHYWNGEKVTLRTSLCRRLTSAYIYLHVSSSHHTVQVRSNIKTLLNRASIRSEIWMRENNIWSGHWKRTYTTISEYKELLENRVGETRTNKRIYFFYHTYTWCQEKGRNTQFEGI